MYRYTDELYFNTSQIANFSTITVVIISNNTIICYYYLAFFQVRNCRDLKTCSQPKQRISFMWSHVV